MLQDGIQLLDGTAAAAPSITLDNIGNSTVGSSGYTTLRSGSTERLRITSSGAWSVGYDGISTGTAGQVLVSNGSGAAPSWQNTPSTSPARDDAVH